MIIKLILNNTFDMGAKNSRQQPKIFSCNHQLIWQTVGFTKLPVAISCITISRDLSLLALTCETSDTTIELWKIKTMGKKSVYLTSHKAKVTNLAFDNNSSQIVSSSTDNIINIVFLKSGHQTIFTEHIGNILNTTPSNNGKLLISSCNKGEIRLWDILKKSCIAMINVDFQPTDIHLHPWSTQFVTANSDYSITQWIFKKNLLKPSWKTRVYVGHVMTVTKVAYSPNGFHVASGSEDGSIRLWNLIANTCEKVLIGHIGPITQLQFNFTGLELVTSGPSSLLEHWSIPLGESFQITTNLISATHVRIFLSCQSNNLIKMNDFDNLESIAPQFPSVEFISDATLNASFTPIVPISFEEYLGQGSFGITYKIRYKELFYTLKLYHTLPHEPFWDSSHYSQIKGRLDFDSNFLSDIVGFYVDHFKHKITITNYYPKGSLHDANKNNVKFSWGFKLYCSLAIFSALEYLHANNSACYNLKSSNVMLCDNSTIKLSDFGIPMPRETLLIFNLRWLSPELLRNNSLTSPDSSDVWAAGMVIHELVNGKVPFADIEESEIIKSRIINRELEQVNRECTFRHPKLSECIKRCWRERSGRPPAKDLSRYLSEEQKTLRSSSGTPNTLFS